MKICFNLRDAKAKDKTAILLIVSHYGKRLKATTGLHISPTAWNAKTNRPKAGQLPHVRERLNQLEAIAEKILSTAGYLTQKDFAKLLNEATGKIEASKTPYLLAFIRQYCEENERKALKSTATTLFNFVTKSKVERWGEINFDKAKTEMLEKWQVVSSHCCRRSFSTLWAKMGLPLADIASATGHTTEKQLMDYIGLTHEEKRDKRRVAVDAAKAKLKAI